MGRRCTRRARANGTHAVWSPAPSLALLLLVQSRVRVSDAPLSGRWIVWLWRYSHVFASFLHARFVACLKVFFSTTVKQGVLVILRT